MDITGAPHEQEFGAEQADAIGAGFQRGRAIVGKFDIGQQRDAGTVARDGRRLLQFAEFFTLAQQKNLALAILFEHDRSRIDDHDSGVAIDDQPVVLRNQRGRVGHADRGRDVEAARNDRGMRILTAKVGNKTAECAIAELQHVGRRDVMRDHDHMDARLTAVARRQRGGAAGKDLQHALADLLNVGLTLAQVGVLDLVELCRQFVDLRDQCPFGVVVAGANDIERHVGDHRIRQDQRMHVDERAEFGR